MRIGMILAVVAAGALAASCSKKSSSLYLVPGRAAEAAKPAAPTPATAPPAVQKASEVEQAQAAAPAQPDQR